MLPRFPRRAGLMVAEVFAPQHEHELVAAFGVEPGEGQGGVGGFEDVAVVADFDHQQAAGVEVGLAWARICRVASRPSSPEPSASAGSA